MTVSYDSLPDRIVNGASWCFHMSPLRYFLERVLHGERSDADRNRLEYRVVFVCLVVATIVLVGLAVGVSLGIL
jgi:hypothetical protein